MDTNPNLNLAAPCGLYCGMCSHYLARAKGKLAEKKLKHGCAGCRVQDKKCSWVKRDCVLLRYFSKDQGFVSRLVYELTDLCLFQ